jgi:sialate O-acetylesterase
MLAPLVPFAIKGAIWYQGESNVGRAKQYSKLFPLMISDWRKHFNEPGFPFYFVQIAPYKYGGDSTQAAGLRDAQRRTLTALPNTGMAVTMDIGETNNIHPADKQDVGKRLSLWALNKTYGDKGIIYSGPLYKSFKTEGNKVIVSFNNTDGGLTSNNKPLKDFELQDADGTWKPATASIEGNTVVVTSDAVAKPAGVRYAYYSYAEGSLFNGKGLPASSFTSEELK